MHDLYFFQKKFSVYQLKQIKICSEMIKIQSFQFNAKLTYIFITVFRRQYWHPPIIPYITYIQKLTFQFRLLHILYFKFILD